MQPAAVIRGYVAAVAVAYLVVIAGVVFGILPWPTLISLVTIPLAYQTWKGLKAHYDRPLSTDVLPWQERQPAPLHRAPARDRRPARDPDSPVTVMDPPGSR
jgi:hypothetical protein